MLHVLYIYLLLGHLWGKWWQIFQHHGSYGYGEYTTSGSGQPESECGTSQEINWLCAYTTGAQYMVMWVKMEDR